jgi:Flp pilus assembly protein TadB
MREKMKKKEVSSSLKTPLVFFLFILWCFFAILFSNVGVFPFYFVVFFAILFYFVVFFAILFSKKYIY